MKRFFPASVLLAACSAPPAPPVTAPSPVATSTAPIDAVPTASASNTSQPREAETATVATSAPPSSTSDDPLSNVAPVVVPAPPFDYTLVRAVNIPASAAPRLVKRSERKNGITDDDKWLSANRLATPFLRVPNPFMKEAGALPPGIPSRFRNLMLVTAIDHHDHFVLVYGRNFSDGHILAVLDANKRLVTLLDFSAWLKPPTVKAGDASFVSEALAFAQVVDDVLYVSNAHRTYAASSGGKNAYVSALDVKTGALLWRSEPLVSNASTFVIRGGSIVSGYGFTAEPDFMFVLDRTNGRVTSKVPVASGASTILSKDGALFVRTYDHDYVFGFDR